MGWPLVVIHTNYFIRILDDAMSYISLRISFKVDCVGLLVYSAFTLPMKILKSVCSYYILLLFF
jgi:hypothetical protein